MKIGIYLGDIKKPESVGGLTFEMSFVNEILACDTENDFVFYYFGKKNIFKNRKNARFVSLNYYKKPQISLSPFHIKFEKIPLCSLNYILKRDKINVVHFLVPYLHEHIEIPYFAVIRDVSHRILPHFPEFNTSSLVEKTEKKLNIFLTSATKIFTCNDVVKNDIITIYDVIDESIVVTPLPYPSWVKTIEADESITKNNGLIENGYILYPAQFWAHKNHIRLVLAAQIMKEQNINLKVVFTGLDRGNKKYLLKKVQELDLEKDVLFLNYLGQSELAELYKKAYAIAYPSLAGTDSIAALEAIYYNKPVLISDQLGYNLQLKKAALYFNPLDERDIVEKITSLNDIALKDDLLSNGKLLIKESTFKNYIDKFLNIVDEFYLIRQCWSLKESYIDK